MGVSSRNKMAPNYKFFDVAKYSGVVNRASRNNIAFLRLKIYHFSPQRKTYPNGRLSPPKEQKF